LVRNASNGAKQPYRADLFASESYYLREFLDLTIAASLEASQQFPATFSPTNLTR